MSTEDINIIIIAGFPEFFTVPMSEVWTHVGHRALLPCDVKPPTPDDLPILVLFYKGATPIYRLVDCICSLVLVLLFFAG